jgi:uncharacterized protein
MTDRGWVRGTKVTTRRQKEKRIGGLRPRKLRAPAYGTRFLVRPARLLSSLRTLSLLHLVTLSLGLLVWLSGPVKAQSPQPRTGKLGRSLTETSASPHVVMQSIGLADVKWTAGFWGERFQNCRNDTIPRLWQIMRGTEFSQFYRNFEIAAGKETGRHRGATFNDGDFYKWLEAASMVYAVTKDAALDRQLDEIIGVIAQAQRADGYIHTPVLIKNRAGDADAQPFRNPLGFELYNMGHLLTAACVHARATGKTNLLDIARKTGDYLDTVFRKPTPELLRAGVCPSHYMGVMELYRATGEPRYRALAAKLIDLRDQIENGTDDNQDRIPFRQQSQAVGHAVRANYLYAGAADVYAETGDRSLLEPLVKIWENVVHRKMYITGGCGALYDGASPDGSKDQTHIGRVHQAYGRDYQLPNSTAHNETCASVAFVLWNWRMLQITGEARYADALERSLYNSVLAGVSLDGRDFFYTNTLRQLDPMPVPLRWSRTRQPFFSSFCCPPNVARTVAEASTYAYGRSAQALWVNLYGANDLDTELPATGRIVLCQETDYPWDGAVKIRIVKTPARPWVLHLRIPTWADGAHLLVNGHAEPKEPEPGRYTELKRIWQAGDVIELDLPMRPRLVQAHPLVEEARNQVAILRGPIVYCLESPDLPEGIRLGDVVIPREISFKPRSAAGLLGGITVMEGKARSDSEPNWSGQLYRELPRQVSQPIDLKLIPYYAWGNRGPSEMTVWLPLGR